MEVLSKTVWDFMEAAHKSGLLDELLVLSGGLTGPDFDLGEMLGNIEDSLVDADFSSFEEIFREVVPPMLRALTDEEVLINLKVFVGALKPVLEKTVSGGDGELKALTETAGAIAKGIVSLRPVVLALLPVFAELYGPQIKTFFEEKAGGIMARAINSGAAAVNKHPAVATRVMSDLYNTIDADSFRKASDILVNGLLDQKPPLAAFTVTTIVKRARTRLLKPFKRS